MARFVNVRKSIPMESKNNTNNSGRDCNTVLVPGTCPNTCNAGLCNSTTFTCVCPSGTSGSFCEILSCPNNCNSNGICTSGAQSSMAPPVCNCSVGYSGEHEAAKGIGFVIDLFRFSRIGLFGEGLCCRC